jgi:hypothetical protein
MGHRDEVTKSAKICHKRNFEPSSEPIFRLVTGLVQYAEKSPLSHATRETDESKISSGVSQSQRGDELIEIVQYLHRASITTLKQSKWKCNITVTDAGNSVCSNYFYFVSISKRRKLRQSSIARYRAPWTLSRQQAFIAPGLGDLGPAR